MLLTSFELILKSSEIESNVGNPRHPLNVKPINTNILKYIFDIDFIFTLSNFYDVLQPITETNLTTIIGSLTFYTSIMKCTNIMTHLLWNCEDAQKRFWKISIIFLQTKCDDILFGLSKFQNFCNFISTNIISIQRARNLI